MSDQQLHLKAGDNTNSDGHLSRGFELFCCRASSYNSTLVMNWLHFNFAVLIHISIVHITLLKHTDAYFVSLGIIE